MSSAIKHASRSILVTGSTDGIGLHTAKRLAREGRPLFVHGRNEKRVASAIEQVKKVAVNPEQVHGLTADFSSLDNVRKLADWVKSQLGGQKLGVLINNAGVMEMTGPTYTTEGFEYTWGVNVAAPFLLTSLLIEDVGDRVVNVSSISSASRIDFSNLQQEKGFSAHNSYSLSKLANQMFNTSLAERLKAAGSPVTANSQDPGTVNTKMLLAGWGPCGIPVQEANDEHWLATAPELDGVSGKYFVSRRQSSLEPPSKDKAMLQRLWDVLEEQTGAQWSI